MFCKYNVLSIAILFGFAFSISNTYGQNVSDTIHISEILVSDSLINQANVFDISDQSKLKVNTGEMLNSIPGISVMKRGVFSAEPMIRTFKYDQVNTLIDGTVRASSSCPNRMDPITTRISPNEINQVELIKGPYSVRHGQILGGTVNMETPNPVFINGLKINGNMGLSYNTNGSGTTVFAGVSQSSGKLFNSLSGNHRQSSNYTSGDGTEIASSFTSFGIDYKGGLKISNNQLLSVGVSYAQANDVLHAGLPMDADYDQSTILNGKYQLFELGKLVDKLSLQVYYSMEDHQMTNKNRPNSVYVLAETPVNSSDAGGKLESVFSITDHVNFFVGTDYWYTHKDGVKNSIVYQNVCTGMVMDPAVEKTAKVWQDSYQSNWGVFGQLEHNYKNILQSKVGVRSNFSKSEINDPAANFEQYYGDSLNVDDELLWNYFGTIEYFLFPNFSIALKAGVGTRSPDLLERYINHFTVGLDMYEYVGNPTLEPEKNQQIDVVLSKTGKVFSIYADLYYSKLQNYISAAVDTTLPRLNMPCKDPKFAKRFINIDKAQMYGAEVGFNLLLFKYFNLSSALQYNYAQNIDWDEPLPEIPPLQLNAALKFKYKKIVSQVEIEYQAEQNRISESFGEMESPSFFIANFNLQYSLITQLNVGCTIDNIFDVNYYRHLSRPYKNMDTSSPFYEPGRNFNIYMTYNF